MTETYTEIDIDDLERLLCERARLAEHVMDETAAFVSPPNVHLKINAMMASGSATADDFAMVIMSDPSLTARLLKLVNSPYYGFNTTIETVSRAVALVGMKDLSNLVVSVCAIRSFSGISSTVTNMRAYWQHSLFSAIACRLMAENIHDVDGEKIFIAGLLHDVGTLIVNYRFPEIAEQSVLEAASDEKILAATERRWLGFDHAFLGGQILSEWSLSESLCEAVSYHHSPASAPTAKREASLIELSDVVAFRAGYASGFGSDVKTIEVPHDSIERSGLPEAYDFDELADRACEEFIATEAAIIVL